MKRKMLMISLVTVLLFVLAACNSNSTDSDGKASTDNGKKVTLKIIHWQQENINNYIKQFNAKFEEKYPDVKVEYTTVPADATYDQLMQTRMNAGSTGDVDIIPLKSSFVGAPQDWSKGAADPMWKQWIDAGLISDLSDQTFIKNYNEVDVQNAMTYNDKVYGVNMGKVAFTGLFYNKDLFAKYNLQVPTTWDELQNVIKVFKDNGVEALGFAGKDVWPIGLAVQGLQASIHDDQLSYIKGLWTGQTKLTDPVQIEVLQKAQTLMNSAMPGFMGIDYGTLPSLFATGKVAMIADGTWDATTIQAANPELKFGYFPIPGSNDAAKNKDLAGKYDMTWMVVDKSPNKDYALKWLEMLSEKDNYTDFVNAAGFLPTQPDVQITSEFIKDIQPYLENFKLSWDQLFINRQNVGQYIAESSVHAEMLKPAGPIATPEELASKSQADWDAAAPK
ncbi:putative ABC transporter extracellular-binding protein YurO [Paenibacillus silvae]|uniref:ABC transporter extracellular-binding protein YurO n=1 Tax=Paenibacillus silvae TaxID=1325358 RepID=A0ABQ1ZH37_9BACL|nr:extracellular solute-binding protein [Paenibacillus silvae]GGH66439.1 putative ABC transporter extracellular-binding protein YurO [Paenibacillus silvae]